MRSSATACVRCCSAVRVLLVNDLPPGPVGGAEVHVGRLVEALGHLGHEVSLYCAERPHVGWRRALDLWDPAARGRIRRRIDEFAPDVVHYHNVCNELSTSVVGVGVPSVLTVHDSRLLGSRIGVDHGRSGLAPGVAARRAKDRIARARLRRRVDATIVPNADMAARARAAGFPAVHHIVNSTPITVAGPPGDDVVFVGTLATHKGPDVLLQAWRAVEARHPSSMLRIVGDGPLRAALEDEVRRSGLQHRVDMVGPVPADAVPEVLVGAALVAVPSVGSENSPLVVLEALAAGRPVVVSDWAGARDTVDEEVGLVVPASDADALGSAIDALLSDHQRLSSMGAAAGRRAAERFAPERVVPRLVDVYRSVLQR